MWGIHHIEAERRHFFGRRLSTCGAFSRQIGSVAVIRIILAAGIRVAYAIGHGYDGTVS
jgi:hypothetical protein